MNKSEIINDLYKDFAAEHTKKSVTCIVDGFLGKIKGALDECDTVRIKDFGTFKVKTYNARKGRNPKTGETIQIPERDVVKFVPSKTLS